MGTLHALNPDAIQLPQPPVFDGESTADLSSRLALYVPPETFADSAFNSGETLGDQETADIVFTVTVNGNEGRGLPFQLRRPPVILAHGLNSSPATWNTNVWTDAIQSPGLATRIFKLDYEATNDQGYDTNWVRIPPLVDQVIADYRSGAIDNNPTGLRYAASRVDWVGHSMGGVLMRVYACGLEANQPRKPNENHRWIIVDRTTETHEYLNPQNWYAGPVRRFISIGSPFDGSGLANLAEGVLKWASMGENTINVGKTIGRWAKGLARFVENDGQFGMFPADIVPSWEETLNRLGGELNAAAFDWTDFPDAIIDLQPDSIFQQFVEGQNAAYPTGHRRILWHPVIGIAHHQIHPDDWREFIWDGIFFALGEAAEKYFEGGKAAFDTANATDGDIVVKRQSQANGQPETHGSPFSHTIHSGPPIPPLGIRPETNHADIAARVRELLSKPAQGVGWQGDISQ